MSFRNRHERRSGVFNLLLVSCLVYAALSFGPVASGQASQQETAPARADTLLKSSKQLRIGVIGDSMASNLADGMERLLSERDNLDVVKLTKPATGLIRDDIYKWNDALKGFIRTTKPDIVLVMIGGNDRQSLWMNGRRIIRGSKAWLAEYERRVVRFMDILGGTPAKVYWVGLPIVRSERMSRDYQALNQIFHKQADEHGFTYVSTWKAFLDENGEYSSFGPSLEGVKRRLRKDDGMHFTMDGELRLAHEIAGEIARDLAEIKTAH